jgi:predicted NACHT family NTPase
MARRSLKASSKGINKAKQAFNRKGWTQEYLAGEIGIETRQPIWKFFSGRYVDRGVFNDICFVLEIDPEEVTEKPDILNDEEFISQQSQKEKSDNIVNLINKICIAQNHKIQSKCGKIRLLDVASNINLIDLYVDTFIVEEINSQRWIEISDFQSEQHKPNYLSHFNKVNQQQKLSGSEAVRKYSKLLVLGKPGAGKTTFLQYIAIQCNQELLEKKCIPIFISLKDFSEDIQCQNSLTNYIYKQFQTCEINSTEIEQVLIAGKTKILLDGLDEVLEKNINIVTREISKFSDNYYNNTIIITCRTAGKHYKFQGFTEVEIADFGQSEIVAFANKWFLNLSHNNPSQGKVLASQFIEKLEMPENRLIQELATTPLLLNLTCLVFQHLKDFPTKRSELYRQGLDLLLVRWDEARGIKRDDIYGNLSLLDKIKLLSHLGAKLFEEGNYFFKEDKICTLIKDYLRHMPKISNDLEALDLESKVILKSIELQHGLLVEQARGLYSFSHLTFHEYFTSRKFVASSKVEDLEKLASKITKKRWREVILLTSSMLQPADVFLQLMKEEIDRKFANEHKLQSFLRWVMSKSDKVTASYYPTAVRAFYFTLALPTDHPLFRNQALALSLDANMGGNLTNKLALDLALINTLAVVNTLTPEIFDKRLNAVLLALKLDDLLIDNPSLLQALRAIKSELPSLDENTVTLQSWWKDNSEQWIIKLRTLVIEYCQIGEDWQFSTYDWELIQDYWYANNLLIYCLNNSYHETSSLQQSIEGNLLMPSNSSTAWRK